MKSIALLGFVFAMSPVLAAADQSVTPDAAAAGIPHPSMAAMEQMHAQMEQIHQRARLQMLASLTPAHRAALANIIGQLAVSPNPDRAAAARAIDATLSAGERNAVLSTESAARTQSRSMMEAQRAQFEASLTPDQKAAIQARMAARAAAHPQGMTHVQRTPDAGMALLDLSGAGGEHRGFRGGPGMGEPPPQ